MGWPSTPTRSAAAAFPGLVLAAGLGFAPMAGAMGTGALVAAGVGGVSARRRAHYDVATALTLVGALVVGVVLASNVFHSGLGGGLAAVRQPVRARRICDLVLGAVASVLALIATVRARAALARDGLRCQRRPRARRALPAARPDVARARRLRLGGHAGRRRCAAGHRAARRAGRDGAAVDEPPAAWQLASVALTAAIGLAGVWLSVRTNAPPGATVAALGGGAFLLSVLVNEIQSRYSGRNA